MRWSFPNSCLMLLPFYRSVTRRSLLCFALQLEFPFCFAIAPPSAPNFSVSVLRTMKRKPENNAALDLDETIPLRKKPKNNTPVLLHNERLARALIQPGQDGPTSNQTRILAEVLSGTSLIAHGPYGKYHHRQNTVWPISTQILNVTSGWNEHRAIQVVALEVLNRYKVASTPLNVDRNMSPTVLHISGSDIIRDSFEHDVRRLSNGAVQVGSLRQHVTAINVSNSQWDIVCTTPRKLLGSLTAGFVHLGQVRLIIFEEANILLAPGFNDEIIKIGRFLEEQQDVQQAVRLHVASVLTPSQQSLILEQSKGASTRIIQFNSSSDPGKSIELSFTTFADKYAEALRPQQTRKFVLSSLADNRSVLAFTSEATDLKVLSRELNEWITDAREVELSHSQLLRGHAAEQLALGQARVLVVSLMPITTGVIAPALRNLEVNVVICRLHEADKCRDSFEKWLDLLGRMTEINVKQFHTLLETERKSDIESISKWMENVRGKVPEELSKPLLPSNADDVIDEGPSLGK